MSAETIAQLDPNALSQAAEDARNEAHRLLDLADERAIRADLVERLNKAEIGHILAQGRLTAAEDQLCAVEAEIADADEQQRERAERVRGALERELGEDLADEVSG